MTLISFAECPEISHETVSQLIIQTEEDSAGGCSVLTVDNCLEVIAVLNSVRGIYSTNVTVEYILRCRQQAGTINERAIFESGIALAQDKSIPVIVDSRARQIPGSAEPLRGTSIRNEVIHRARQRRGSYSDGHPERTIRCGRGSEDLTFIISNLPVAAIGTFDQRRSEIHCKINRLTGRDLCGKRHEVLPSYRIAANQYHAICGSPYACTGVSQPPDLGEGAARSKDRVVWYR